MLPAEQQLSVLSELTESCHGFVFVSAGGEDDRAVEGEREHQEEGRSRDAPLWQLLVVKRDVNDHHLCHSSMLPSIESHIDRVAVVVCYVLNVM
jgi:hypothetical protein